MILSAFVLSMGEDGCPRFAAFPASKGPAPEGLRCKTVHLIRHAEGTHNAAEQMADRLRLYEKSNETRALRDEHGIAWYLLVLRPSWALGPMDSQVDAPSPTRCSQDRAPSRHRSESRASSTGTRR